MFSGKAAIQPIMFDVKDQIQEYHSAMEYSRNNVFFFNDLQYEFLNVTSLRNLIAFCLLISRIGWSPFLKIAQFTVNLGWGQCKVFTTYTHMTFKKIYHLSVCLSSIYIHT